MGELYKTNIRKIYYMIENAENEFKLFETISEMDLD
jgi:hypothetical protein